MAGFLSFPQILIRVLPTQFPLFLVLLSIKSSSFNVHLHPPPQPSSALGWSWRCGQAHRLFGCKRGLLSQVRVACHHGSLLTGGMWLFGRVMIALGVVGMLVCLYWDDVFAMVRHTLPSRWFVTVWYFVFSQCFVLFCLLIQKQYFTLPPPPDQGSWRSYLPGWIRGRLRAHDVKVQEQLESQCREGVVLVWTFVEYSVLHFRICVLGVKNA